MADSAVVNQSDTLDFSDLFQAVQPPKSKRPPAAAAAAAPRTSAAAPGGEKPCLVLQHYATPPQMLFGEVAARSSVTRALTVRNESNKV